MPPYQFRDSSIAENLREWCSRAWYNLLEAEDAFRNGLLRMWLEECNSKDDLYSLINAKIEREEIESFLFTFSEIPDTPYFVPAGKSKKLFSHLDIILSITIDCDTFILEARNITQESLLRFFEQSGRNNLIVRIRQTPNNIEAKLETLRAVLLNLSNEYSDSLKEELTNLINRRYDGVLEKLAEAKALIEKVGLEEDEITFKEKKERIRREREQSFIKRKNILQHTVLSYIFWVFIILGLLFGFFKRFPQLLVAYNLAQVNDPWGAIIMLFSYADILTFGIIGFLIGFMVSFIVENIRVIRELRVERPTKKLLANKEEQGNRI